MNYLKSLEKIQLFKEQLNKQDLDHNVFFNPTKVYDTYYAIYIIQRGLADNSLTELAFIIEELKDYYIEKYKIIVCLQLYKYWQRGRVSEEFATIVQKYNKLSDLLGEDISVLLSLMRNTFRSDMTRLNKTWIDLVSHLNDLDKMITAYDKKSIESMLLKMDRINNTVHNTKMPMLDKFSNGHQLLEALNDVHSASPEQIKRMVGDKFLRSL